MKSSTPGPRQRVTRPDEAAKDGGEVGKIGGEVEDGPALEQAEGTEEAQPTTKARGRAPYAASGPSVIDADGRVVCVCLEGVIAVREATAAWIADKLNA